MTLKPERFWNVPNALTISRLVMTVFILIQIELGYYLGAFGLFLLAAISDGLDGYFARLLNQATVLGRQLDPLVDKVVIAALYVQLLTVPDTGLAPWMVNIVIARELLIQGLRSHLEGQGQNFAAKFAGKLKMTFQCISIGGILLFLSLRPSTGWLRVRDVATWLAVALTIYSGLVYVMSAIRLVRSRAAGDTAN